MGWSGVRLVWTGDAAVRIQNWKLHDVAVHMLSYPLEIAAGTLPWSLLLVLYLRRDFRQSQCRRLPAPGALPDAVHGGCLSHVLDSPRRQAALFRSALSLSGRADRPGGRALRRGGRLRAAVRRLAAVSGDDGVRHDRGGGRGGWRGSRRRVPPPTLKPFAEPPLSRWPMPPRPSGWRSWSGAFAREEPLADPDGGAGPGRFPGDCLHRRRHRHPPAAERERGRGHETVERALARLGSRWSASAAIWTACSPTTTVCRSSRPAPGRPPGTDRGSDLLLLPVSRRQPAATTLRLARDRRRIAGSQPSCDSRTGGRGWPASVRRPATRPVW